MACSNHTIFPTGKPVTISVNGVTIARDAIQREMQHHPASKPIAAWQQAAGALIVRELLLQRAKHLGIKTDPISDRAGRYEADDEALIRALIEREVSTPEPDGTTCRRYYENNLNRFRSPDIYEASHILFAAIPTDRDAYAQARADAAAVLATVRDNPECFELFAKAYSRCSSAEQGGRLGQITKGQTTPQFEQALMALSPGEVCAEPVETRYGFHVIRLEHRHDGRLLPYEMVSEHIAEYLRESVQRRANAQYIARLISAARIEGVELPGAEWLRVH